MIFFSEVPKCRNHDLLKRVSSFLWILSEGVKRGKYVLHKYSIYDQSVFKESFQIILHTFFGPFQALSDNSVLVLLECHTSSSAVLSEY